MEAMNSVEVGMKVLDNTGRKLGEVDELKFGDANAATDRGQQPRSGGLLEGFTQALGAGSNLHPQAAERLQRIGYIRVDLDGPFAGHGYATGDWVQTVENGAVLFSVAADDLYHG